MRSEKFRRVLSQGHLCGCELPRTKNYRCVCLLRFVIGHGVAFNEQDKACCFFTRIAPYNELLVGTGSRNNSLAVLARFSLMSSLGTWVS